tara:strand:- start:32 stop:994 length:963 start_codon:yes stop_codon:yes gene_type:complete
MLAALIIVMFCLNITLYFKIKSRISVHPPVAEGPQFSPLPDRPSEPIPPRREYIPNFVMVPEFRKHSEESVYGDVMSHSKDSPFGDRAGRATNAHETAHGIHSYLRNKYTRERDRKVNGLYVLEGRGVIVEEPKMRKSDINKFVPKNLRSYRYDTYLAGQKAWDDTPLYIYDEWNAYILGGMTNVEDVQKGRYKGGWTDGVSGCLGFSIYAVATCMAVKEHDSVYWENNEQFRNLTIWLLYRSQETYKIGHRMEEFQWEKQDKLLNEFLTSSEAAPMREFIQEHLDGVWLSMDVKMYGGSSRISHHIHGLTQGCRHCRGH